MVSINTNYAASLSRQAFSGVTSELGAVEARIGSGRKLLGAKDNGAVFALAAERVSDLQLLSHQQRSFERVTGILDVALAAADAIHGILIELKELVSSAQDSSLTASQKEAYNTEFVGLRDQIDYIAGNAEFDGINIVDGSITHFAVSGIDSVVIGHSDLTLKGSALNFTSSSDLKTNTPSLEDIRVSIGNVTETRQKFANWATGLEVRGRFASRVADVSRAGLGKLVDADIGKESARLESLQTRQQLASQTVSIANSVPSIILSFFQRG